MTDAYDCMGIYDINTRGLCEKVTYRANTEYAGGDGGTAPNIDLGPYESPSWDTSTAFADGSNADAVGHLFTSYPPPRNARAYWDGSAIGHPDGHVAISSGAGTVRSTDFPWGVISDQSIDYITNATGYRYMGWSDKFGGFDVQHLGAVSTTTAVSGGVGSNQTSRSTTDVQDFLIAAGYDVGASGADGEYGPVTTAAVKAYQADHGLTPDGIYGPMTDQSMFPPAFTHVDDAISVDGDEGRQTAAKEQKALGVTVDGTRGPETISAEQRLTGATVDGSDGPDTTTHLQQYLTALGYPVAIDGSRGPETISALQRALNDGKFGQPIPAAPAADPTPTVATPADQPDVVTPETPAEGTPNGSPVSGGGVSPQDAPAQQDSTTTTPEEAPVTVPITSTDADKLRTNVTDAAATIPAVSIPDDALGSVVTDSKQRAVIYSWTMLVGIALKMLGAGIGAGVTSGFAIWAALTIGIAEQAQTAVAPWLPLIVTCIAIFAFATGAYAVWAQQVVSLARANTK